MDLTTTIKSLEHRMAEIDHRIKQSQGVIVGQPLVIELVAGLYLVADGDGYRGGSITGRVVCYSPERIDAAVEHCRAHSDGVFSAARKVDYREALRRERDFTADLIARIQQQPQPATA